LKGSGAGKLALGARGPENRVYGLRAKFSNCHVMGKPLKRDLLVAIRKPWILHASIFKAYPEGAPPRRASDISRNTKTKLPDIH